MTELKLGEGFFLERGSPGWVDLVARVPRIRGIVWPTLSEVQRQKVTALIVYRHKQVGSGFKDLGDLVSGTGSDHKV